MTAAKLRHFANQGFTLIEILIAMTILFATITTGLMAYQNALAGSERASQIMHLLSYVTPVQQHIKQQLLVQPDTMQGEGIFGQVEFSWQAQLTSFKSAPDRFDPDSGEFITLPPRFRLLIIDLNLSYQQRQRSFQYQEIAWLAPQEN